MSQVTSTRKGTQLSKLLAISIWTWCSKWKTGLLAEHAPDQLNKHTDEESRGQCDWINFYQIDGSGPVCLMTGKAASMLQEARPG